MRGACRLLSACHHFNCRQELVECVTPLLNHRMAAIRRVAFDSVVAVFGGDQQGDAVVDCLRVIAKLVNRKRQLNRRYTAAALHLLPHRSRLTAARMLGSLWPLCDEQCGECTPSC